MLPCLNKTLLGIDCYGCGGQRAAILLFQGNFREAFLMYPAIYTLVIFAIFLIINIKFKFKGDFKIKIAFTARTPRKLLQAFSPIPSSPFR